MMTAPLLARAARRWLAALALLAAAGTAAAQPTSPPRADGRRPGFPAAERWTLPNGLEVAFVPLPGSPVASVQVWYRVGAVDDPAGKQGLASLFEDLMFAGSARLRPGDHLAYLAAVGGQTNASVVEDASAFIDTVPVERFELALDLEAERMRSLELSPDAVAEAIARRQGELERLSQSARWQVFRRLVSASFVQHPYKSGVAPAPVELTSITAGDARAFYDAYYQPSNALLVIAGGLTRDAVAPAIERRFAGLAKAPPAVRPGADRPEPPQSARRDEEVAGAGASFGLAFHVPAAGAPDIAALKVAEQLLSGGSQGRLSRLVDQGKLAAYDGVLLLRRDPGLIVVRGEAAAGASAEAGAALVLAELRRLASGGPSAAELKRARKQVAQEIYQSTLSASGIAAQIGYGWIVTGAVDGTAAALAARQAVSAADVARAVRTYLVEDRATVVVGTGGK